MNTNFDSSNVDGINVGNSNLTNTNWDNGNINNSSFDNSNLSNTSFDNTNFNSTVFDNTNAINSNFKSSSLINSNFIDSNFDDSNFDNSSLNFTSINDSSINNVSFDNSFINNSNINNISLKNSSFQDTSITNSSINNSTATSSNWSNSDFSNTSITASEFSDTNFSNANIGNELSNITSQRIVQINSSEANIFSSPDASLKITGVNLETSDSVNIILRDKNNQLINVSSFIVGSDNDITLFGLDLSKVTGPITAQVSNENSTTSSVQVANVVSANTPSSVLTPNIPQNIATNGNVFQINGNGFTTESIPLLKTSNNIPLTNFTFTVDSPNLITVSLSELPTIGTTIVGQVNTNNTLSNSSTIGKISTQAIPASVTPSFSIINNQTAIINGSNFSNSNNIVQLFTKTNEILVPLDIILTNKSGLQGVASNTDKTQLTVQLKEAIPQGPIFAIVSSNGILSEKDPVQIGIVNFNLPTTSTFSGSGSTITITSPNHGFSIGDSVNLDFISGSITNDGNFKIIAISKNTFTIINDKAVGNTTGSVNIEGRIDGTTVIDNRTKIILSNFISSSFNGASLVNTVLFGSSFINSDFQNSNFINTEINESNFTNADFRGANLSEAIIIDSIFCGAIYDNTTIWPKNFDVIAATRCDGSVSPTKKPTPLIRGDVGIWRASILDLTEQKEEDIQ